MSLLEATRPGHGALRERALQPPGVGCGSRPGHDSAGSAPLASSTSRTRRPSSATTDQLSRGSRSAGRSGVRAALRFATPGRARRVDRAGAAPSRFFEREAPRRVTLRLARPRSVASRGHARGAAAAVAARAGASGRGLGRFGWRLYDVRSRTPPPGAASGHPPTRARFRWCCAPASTATRPRAGARASSRSATLPASCPRCARGDSVELVSSTIRCGACVLTAPIAVRAAPRWGSRQPGAGTPE